MIAKTLTSRKLDWVIAFLILAAGLRLTFGLENFFDVKLWDECGYLYHGVKLADLGFSRAAWGPLYALWYYILSLFQPDRVSLSYLNHKLMIILPPILAYILIRRNKVPACLGLLVAFYLPVSYAIVSTSVRVSHLALMIILVTLIFISGTASLFRAGVFASFGALGASYVRPEYFLTYILSLVFLAAITIFVYRKPSRRQLTALTALALTTILLLVILGSPASSDRGMVAFGQHFSLNWTEWTGSKLNPFSDWQIIISENFGNAQNVFEAFRNNPSMFLRHIGYNARETMTHHFLPLFVPIFPVSNLFKTTAELGILGFLIVRIPNIYKNLVKYGRFLFFAGLFLLPELASAALIYPRDHYLLLPFVLVIVIAAILAGGQPLKQERVDLKQLILLGLLLIVLLKVTPTFSSLPTTQKPNLAAIRVIQSLDIKEPVNLLENMGGYYSYLGDNFTWITSFDKAENFNNFLVARKINMIVASHSLSVDTRFKHDREWMYFLKNYAGFGFAQMDIPNTENKIFIRNDLLNK